MTPEDMREGFQKALTQAGEGHTLADLEQELSSGDALLWIGSQSAIVTTMHDGPEGRFLHVWLGCGDLGDMVSLEPGIAAYARARGCKFASMSGRGGWERVFRKRGFNRASGELRKVL